MLVPAGVVGGGWRGWFLTEGSRGGQSSGVNLGLLWAGNDEGVCGLRVDRVGSIDSKS